MQQKKCPPLSDTPRSTEKEIGFLFYTLSDVNWRHFTCVLRTGTCGVQGGWRVDTGSDCPSGGERRPLASCRVSPPLHFTPLRSPLSSDRWCERQSRTNLLPHHQKGGAQPLWHRTPTDRPTARPPSAAPGRSPQSTGAAVRWREIHCTGVSSRATSGAGAERSVWGGRRAVGFGGSLRPVYRSSRRRADPSNTALRAMPV